MQTIFFFAAWTYSYSLLVLSGSIGSRERHGFYIGVFDMHGDAPWPAKQAIQARITSKMESMDPGQVH